MRVTSQARQLMNNKLIGKLLIWTRVLIVAICFVAAYGGHYPPAYAQHTPQTVISTEDSLQDDHIAALNKHLDNTDANVAVLSKRSEEQANDMSSWRGGVATALTIIGILTGGGLVLQVKKPK